MSHFGIYLTYQLYFNILTIIQLEVLLFVHYFLSSFNLIICIHAVLGESILICKETEKGKAEHLLSSTLPPVKSCLIKNEHDSLSNSMKRAILEVRNCTEMCAHIREIIIVLSPCYGCMGLVSGSG